ncbi:calcium-binding tyrosine phosphorylation-regulated protein isoform X2 [Onychomys torridus]|uniref:calcium-binding tyrosine phosphorylation-regulated protein isoform X2 n=1 Tax=Onychomys torridus TaxID=38674 RepID=UPI00167F911C|nr:calcium-binding tyrosine phosphorylation-regulated protein isoform X2 [Onychomys torridus]XP_036060148.1 calcium-binding tyrosine phosphorylation-regulated protein isoform X2 [Onychomys torridus]
MISSKPRLVVPYGLKTLLEGVSRAILKTNPTNITQFAAVYFKELIVFREGNSSLDIKDLIKQFHQTKVEKWAEGATLEKKECVKESGRTPPVSCEPARLEKSTDTEEDNVAGPLFSNKTTQFPSVHAELQPEETCEGVWGPSSKPTTPKTTTPPTSPPPAPVSAEYAYVPADPAQFAAQMLALATSEAGQPPPYSNMWTLYCLTDMNQQSRPSPPPALGPFPQATLYLPNPKDPPQFLQNPPKVTSPTYVMMDDSKKTSAPPFILVGSNVQEAQDWKPLPGHTVVSQSEALKRYAAVQVPIAVPADQTFQRPAPNPQNASPPTSGQDGPRPKSPVFLSVAFPVEDVAKKSSGSGDKRTPFGSYGIAGEITVTTAHVRRAEP